MVRSDAEERGRNMRPLLGPPMPSSTMPPKGGKHRAHHKAARAKKVSVLPDIIGTALDNGAEIDALAKLSVEKQQGLAQAAKRGEQVSAIPRDHNPNQMSDVSEIERSGCNDPEVPHLDVERGDTSEVKDERISPPPDGDMPDADAQLALDFSTGKPASRMQSIGNIA